MRALGKFVARGLVYKGKKPVHWCLRDRTALAEAEVEYETHTSPSIYVEFPVSAADAGTLGARVPALAGRDVTVLIWTTTPWTIPSNLAIAFHPDFDYAAYEYLESGERAGGSARVVILAEALAGQVAETTGRPWGRQLASFKGSALEGVRFRHPLYDRDSPGVLAHYVTLDQGTGAVHTAPGHGADDFATGVRYELDIYAPIGTNGRFAADVGIVGGLKVFEANPVVEAALAERGRLWFRTEVAHSYPHCWRCHSPVIFLATSQWFISMDGLREAAVAEANAVKWIPEWGRERMTGMFLTRPDWCISRQRAWGVPIPALACDGCGESGYADAGRKSGRGLNGAHRRRRVGKLRDRSVRAGASRARSAAAPRSHASATSGRLVRLRVGQSGRAGAASPAHLADLYLEGTDRYRGWFQSSLLVGVGTRDRAPYAAFSPTASSSTCTGGRCPSLGVVVRRRDQGHGAEILQLWVSMVDRDEVRLGKEVISRTVEAHRDRNTLGRVPVEPLTSIRRAIWSSLRLLRVDRVLAVRRALERQRVRRLRLSDDLHAITSS